MGIIKYLDTVLSVRGIVSICVSEKCELLWVVLNRDYVYSSVSQKEEVASKMFPYAPG